jgi:ATP-binding cassette subfamily C protein LapB
MPTDSLLPPPDLLQRAARLSGRHVPAERLARIDAAGGAKSAAEAFRRAWQSAGLDGRPEPVLRPQAADLPCVARSGGRWVCLLAPSAQGGWRAADATGAELHVTALDADSCLRLPPRAKAQPASTPSALRLVVRALLKHRRSFLEASLASVVVNLLALATSLYSMQVYDRVIPNQGLQTLLVLTTGVGVAVLLELVLKHVRAKLVDLSSNAIDHELSRWFFSRAMGIRMEARPETVGTLASQVKGFEQVRGVLASTSIFVLTDVPFGIFFVAVIVLLGGPVGLVPLVVLPLALLAGLGFQRSIRRHAQDTHNTSNRKTGLLVEAVDGAESIKAQGGEWAVQRRWNDLLHEGTASDQSLRDLGALSQNLTAALQQLGYIALIGVGAWLATRNELTMGALLACSILSNRALAPVVQLPGVMVQWAHARTALDGLDKLLELPNEEAEAGEQLAATPADAGLQFQQVRFAYGQAKRHAIEIEKLELKPGDRVGIVGPIGSGKSTLLKLASGLYKPNDGRVQLGGIDMQLLQPAVLREMVGYLPQDFRLLSGTLRDNLLLGLPDPGDEALLDAARRTGLLPLVSAHPKGLALPISEGGRGVSGGQRQLVGLTRLLLGRPRLWLLDEPTGSMDADHELRVLDLLRTAIGPDDTAIVSTHKTALLPLFNKLWVMQGGRIVIAGPRDDVMAQLSGKPRPAAGAPGAPAASRPAEVS